MQTYGQNTEMPNGYLFKDIGATKSKGICKASKMFKEANRNFRLLYLFQDLLGRLEKLIRTEKLYHLIIRHCFRYLMISN